MKELAIGGVTFKVEYRHFGGDHGPAVRVYGDVGGKPVQLLRFDCFENDPHYHYEPDGKNKVFHLDPLTMGDPTEFSLAQIEKHARRMIEKAGYSQVAARVDQGAIASSVRKIKEAIEAEKASA